MRLSYLLIISLISFSSCKYYLEGQKVSRENYKYCSKIKSAFLSIDSKENTIRAMCGKSGPHYQENPITGELEEGMFSFRSCSCKEFYIKYKQDTSKIKR